MRRVHLVQAAAVLWFLAGAVGGTFLVTYQGLVPIDGHGDCTRPVGSSGGCFTVGNPYWWVGVLVWGVALIGAVVLWSIATSIRARSPSEGRGRSQAAT